MEIAKYPPSPQLELEEIQPEGPGKAACFPKGSGWDSAEY